MAAASMTTARRLLWQPTLKLCSRFQTATTARGFPSTTSLRGGSRRGYSAQPPRGPNNAVKFWPFAAIIAMGSGAYVLLARTRAENRYGSGRRAQ